MNLIDLSLPIYNGMWHYRPGWENSVREIESVLKGGNVTIYGFDLCSHTGTYIETSHHKLKEEILSMYKLLGENLNIKMPLLIIKERLSR